MTDTNTPDALMRNVAADLLDTKLEALVSRAVTLVKLDEPEYAASHVSWDDLTRMMRRTLALALTRLACRPVPDSIATAAGDAGRLRAQQGLPLPALLHAFRIDLRVIWEAVVWEGKIRGTASSAALIEGSMLIWEAVEANTAEVVEAYGSAERDIALHLDELRRRAFERLVQDGERDGSAVREAASRLDLPVDGPFMVVVAKDAPQHHEAAVITANRLRAAGATCSLIWSQGEMTLLVAASSRPEGDLFECLGELSGVRAGVACGEGLAWVPCGLRLARRIVAAMTGPGVRALGDAWVATMVNADSELAQALGKRVLGPLLQLPENERSAILETVETFLDGGGSVADVAAKLYRHRNTVRYRLQAAERLSGLDFSRPADLATMLLAIEWLRGPAGGAYDSKLRRSLRNA